jgi:hypothetical protein
MNVHVMARLVQERRVRVVDIDDIDDIKPYRVTLKKFQDVFEIT